MTTTAERTESADIINARLSDLVLGGKISPDEKNAFMWLHGKIRADGMSLRTAAEAIGYSSATLSRIFAAAYAGSYTEVAAKIRAWRGLLAERAEMPSIPFLETSVWETVRKSCDLALIHRIPALIMGLPQMGKTTALKHYRERTEFPCYFVRIPAAATFRGALEAIAAAVGVTADKTTERLRRRIFRAIDRNSLLIIDEFHQLATSSGRLTAMKIAEYIRELADETGCGLLLCGTFSVAGDLLNGPLRDWLEQLSERLINRVSLPTTVPPADIRLAAAAYGLDAEPDAAAAPLLRNIRMNRLVRSLALARNLAANKGEPLAWTHFVSVFKTISPLSR